MQRSILSVFIKAIIRESTEPKGTEKLLMEPDFPEDGEEETLDKQEEMNTCAGVAGVTTPLGTNSTYPANRKSSKKSVKKTLAKH